MRFTKVMLHDNVEIVIIIILHLQVENMVDHFVKQRKRILVLGCSPMKLQPRGHGEMQTPLAKLMDYLIDREHCGVFCLKERYPNIFLFLLYQ